MIEMKRSHKPMILRSIILLTMASSIVVPIFLLLLLRASAAAADLHEACNATRFPLQCHSSLSPRLPPNPTPLQIIHSAISLSSDHLTLVRSNLRSILNASSTTTTTLLGSVLANNATRSTAFKTCLQVLYYSHHRTSLAARAIPTKHARAWLSAALAYQYGCWSGLTYVNANDTADVPHTMSLLDTLVNLTSNALSMLVSYHRFGNRTSAWTPPLTERHAFWEPPVSQGLAALLPSVPDTLAADATVCKDKGGGCYQRVQDAVNAAPDNGQGRFVIHIMEGVYTERIRIPLRKRNVVFLGDGMGKTVITGSANVGQPGVTTYNSATLGVAGDGFIAKNLTIENTAGPNAHQAVAFRSDSDLSVIENCEFIGNQDTLYAHSLRQFYKSCRILGNVDFIFGNSASIFQDCEILVRPRQERPEKGENNAITAHGRTDPAQSTGFVFHNCTINGTEEYMTLYNSKPQVHRNYLGRPWKEYSRTIFIRSFLGALISPEGWMPWNGDFALKTLYYGEFENSGPGSNLTQRVPWSNQVPAEHVLSYSVQSFIQGDDWNHRLTY